jgi:hypothetical protein
MTPGEISLDVNLAEHVIGGAGVFSELRFRETGQAPVTILTPSDSKPGLTCKSCGHFLVINDFEFTDAECVVCHTTMPAGVTTCPKCGWSYKTGED